ncbi:xenobiotic compound monooxygenase, DszA family [Phaeosphaeria sp. MPI-PUGE-AT-0046c]|nr:xenobiotic compound monooxygenase, DszA family [Phaeosphaeria sp. MPI-PUGE-AT-0046c]
MAESVKHGTMVGSLTRKKILINAFDMSTVGHLSPGQWKNPKDMSASKRRLDYWIDLAKLLELGGINSLYLADTDGRYDTYEGSLDNCIRRAAQWPMTNSSIPNSTTAEVTKHLSFAITGSRLFEPPFLLAKRFRTLDHMTGGRCGWNIVTSWEKAAFKAIGVDTNIEHDERYAQADEYFRWEGSWSPDAIILDTFADSYINPSKIRTIKHTGKYFNLESRHVLDPTPQRTRFIFQAGTSSAGSEFAATHAEAIFVSSHSPVVLAPKIAKIRELAKAKGRDPAGIECFATFTPVLGYTDEEAQTMYDELKSYASEIGGQILVSGWTGIDLSKYPPDHVVTANNATEDNRVRSLLERSTVTSPEKASTGGPGPVSVGSPAKVADELEFWVKEADVDSFNVGYVTTPGSFEDVVDILVPELRRRGVYAEIQLGDAND